MHTNYIYTFLVTKDGKKVITGSKDKKIKVWDWVKQKLINTLLFHEDTVESLVMTVDERLMFSGGLDGKVGIWAMNGFNLISHLISDFPIRTLTLTDDNDYLMAKEKPETRGAEGQMVYWPLEKNEDAFRINVNLKGVDNCYMTPDNMYLAILGKKIIEIWNIQSRTMVKSYEISCKHRQMILKTVNGTRDSEYIMFQKD